MKEMSLLMQNNSYDEEQCQVVMSNTTNYALCLLMSMMSDLPFGQNLHHSGLTVMEVVFYLFFRLHLMVICRVQQNETEPCIDGGALCNNLELIQCQALNYSRL